MEFYREWQPPEGDESVDGSAADGSSSSDDDFINQDPGLSSQYPRLTPATPIAIAHERKRQNSGEVNSSLDDRGFSSNGRSPAIRPPPGKQNRLARS